MNLLADQFRDGALAFAQCLAGFKTAIQAISHQGAAESFRRVHEMTMNRGLPPHICLFMGWADGFRPSLSCRSFKPALRSFLPHPDEGDTTVPHSLLSR